MLMLLNPFVQRRKPNPKSDESLGRVRPLVVGMSIASRRKSSVYLFVILYFLHSKNCSKEIRIKPRQDQYITVVSTPQRQSRQGLTNLVWLLKWKSIEALVLRLLRLARYKLWEAKQKSSRDDVYKHITNWLMLSAKPKPTGHTAGTHAVFDSAREHFLAKCAMAL